MKTFLHFLLALLYFVAAPCAASLPTTADACTAVEVIDGGEYLDVEKTTALFGLSIMLPSHTSMNVATAQCSYIHEKDKIARLTYLRVNQKHQNKGYGTRLVRKAMATFYELYKPNVIRIFAQPLGYPPALDAREKLNRFYCTTGAVIVEKIQYAAHLEYPLLHAALLNALMPWLEPEIASPINCINTIVEYATETDKNQNQPAAASLCNIL